MAEPGQRLRRRGLDQQMPCGPQDTGDLGQQWSGIEELEGVDAEGAVDGLVGEGERSCQVGLREAHLVEPQTSSLLLGAGEGGGSEVDAENAIAVLAELEGVVPRAAAEVDDLTALGQHRSEP